MVRPIEVETEPPRRGPLLAAVATVALAGFAVYLAGGGLSESAPTTTADPVAPSTTTTVAATTTTDPRTPLGRLVPGFQGRVTGVGLFETTAAGWTWASGEPEPRLIPLPAEASGSWSDGVVAAIAESSFGRSLFFGLPNNVREVFNSVESFAWHSSGNQTLAFITVPQPDGLRELWQSTPQPTSDLFSSRLVARLAHDGHLGAYGDWGFALSIVSPSTDPPHQIITLDPDGNFIAQAPLRLVDSFGDGRLLVSEQGGGPNPHLATVEVDLANPRRVGPPAAFDGVLSPNGLWVATVVLGDSGADLLLTSTIGEPEPVSLGVDVASPVAWSADGRWILIAGHMDAPASRGTQLIFADTNSTPARIHSVIVDGTISGLTIDATGVAGHERYRLPEAALQP